MSTAVVLTVALAAAGALTTVLAIVARRREHEAQVAELLDLPPDTRPEQTAERAASAVVERGVQLVQAGLGRSNFNERILLGLERAHAPLRPAEFVLLVGLATVGIAGLLGLLAERVLVTLVIAPVVPVLSWQLVRLRFSRRQAAFAAQLPDFLTLLAASLQAGHSFLRSIQLYAEEAEPPMRDELDRVLAETQLGDPLIDALERMAHRLELPDLSWVVQAVRIQQQVGGGLAELFFTLAAFMREREDVRMETRALTTDARMSAWTLGLLPLVMFVVLQVVGGGYMDVMFSGPGFVALAIGALMAAAGGWVIMRMAKVEV